MKHPEEIISLIIARYNTQGLNRDMLAFEAGRTAQLMQTELVEIGYMSTGRWQHIADVYAELEMQPKGKLPDDFIYSTTQQRLPAWFTTTAAIAVLTILVLAVLVQRNMKLSRQLQREIAAQEVVHQQLEKSEEHSRFMLEHSADTFWELDSEFRFTFVSEADHRMRGFEASEVLGQSLFKMLTPTSLLSVQQDIAARQNAEKLGQATGPMRFEFEMYCKDGSTVWAESNSMPLRDSSGKIIGFHGVTRDTTEQKHHRTELQQANAQLVRQLEEIQELQSRLQEQAIRDALTGLYNRRYLDETLPRELSRAKRDGYPLALIMLDIDHFKQVNDTYGHSAGDEVIRSLGEIIRQGAREGDIACRYGGEEFVIALPRMNVAAALERAEKLRAQAQAIEVQHGDFKICFTISAGTSGYPDHATDYGNLMEYADLALYKSKSDGRNRVTCFDPSTMSI